LGLNPSDTIVLMEYVDDFEWFIKSLEKIYRRKTISNQISLAQVNGVVQGIGSKKGNENFKKFIRNLRNEYHETMHENEKPKKTFWKEAKRMKGKTLFQALKERKK